MKFLVLLLLFSCTKHHKLHSKNGIFYFKDIKNSLSNLKEIDWNVGKQRKENVSKGFRFSIGLPSISEKAQKTLGRKYGIDSWVFRISRLKRGATQSLGYLYFNHKNINRTTQSFTASIYYTSAAVSKRFRLFHCPAFSHRKKITKLSIDSLKDESLDIYVRPLERVAAAVTHMRFAPMILNGGLSMEGGYFVEYALYNSKSKQLYSKWKKVDGFIQVKKERSISIPSCIGIKEEENPLPNSKVPTLKDLEIR